MKKETPILFKAEMIRAILSGTKTQTRRIIKFPVTDWNGTGCEIAGNEINSCLRQGLELCPYGIVGNRLWCREITGIRAERLQDISEEDAKAEGCIALGDADCTAKAQYQSLWDSINGKRQAGKPDVSWAANPWVWKIEFKKL